MVSLSIYNYPVYHGLRPSALFEIYFTCIYKKVYIYIYIYMYTLNATDIIFHYTFVCQLSHSSELRGIFAYVVNSSEKLDRGVSHLFSFIEQQKDITNYDELT
jgi:hypothetical protein